MKILSRILPPNLRPQKTDAKTMVHRRVEVTVDREMASILVPGQCRHAREEEMRGEHGSTERPQQLTQARLDDLARPSNDRDNDPTQISEDEK
ncbi:MAG TPA: hypothetical protein VMA71_09330 [Alloacidobacterium sp.]|nr:hypothetical protein [Alloacidobacterium sp.]